jgi:hypothetical protein
LQLRFGQKEVQLVDERTAAPLLSRPLGRRGSLPFALAGLQGGGTIHCSLRAVHLEGQQEEGAASVLLDVQLLPAFFDVHPGSEVRQLAHNDAGPRVHPARTHQSRS